MSTSTNGTSKWMSRKYSGKTQFSDSVFLLFTVSYWSHNSSIFILHVEYAVLVISDTSGIWFDPYFFSSARKISARTYRNYHLIDIRIQALCPESSENIPILLQEADLYISNQNDLRNPKMGSKQSITGPPEWSFFQITFFGTKNHWKNDIF